jgi:hypothetical protein
MPDEPVNPPASNPPGTPQQSVASFRIGEEFSGAKRNLPPAGIVLICLAGVAVVLGVYAYLGRQKPQGAGSIDYISAAEVTGQNSTMVAITFTLRNNGQRPLWVHTLQAQLTAADGKTFDDQAASAVDFDRYFQAFPALKEHSERPLSPETKLLPGAEQTGTIIVTFPVGKDVFDQRKSLAITIQPYDQPLPVVLTK